MADKRSCSGWKQRSKVSFERSYFFIIITITSLYVYLGIRFK